jgi:hypothetical protein
MQTPADSLERRKWLPKWHQMILPRSATSKSYWGSSRSAVSTRSAERSITRTTAEINDERDILLCPSRREESGGGVVVATDRAGVGARHQVVAGALNATLNPAGLAVGRNVVKRLPEEVG